MAPPGPSPSSGCSCLQISAVPGLRPRGAGQVEAATLWVTLGVGVTSTGPTDGSLLPSCSHSRWDFAAEEVTLRGSQLVGSTKVTELGVGRPTGPSRPAPQAASLMHLYGGGGSPSTPGPQYSQPPRHSLSRKQSRTNSRDVFVAGHQGTWESPQAAASLRITRKRELESGAKSGSARRGRRRDSPERRLLPGPVPSASILHTHRQPPAHSSPAPARPPPAPAHSHSSTRTLTLQLPAHSFSEFLGQWLEEGLGPLGGERW